jgi:hypothetical protein
MTSKNLYLLHQDETDFEVPKKSDAFRMEFNQKGRGVIVSARTMINLNQGLSMLPTYLFSIQMSNTNSKVNSSFRDKYNLDFTDKIILRPSVALNSIYSLFFYILHTIMP